MKEIIFNKLMYESYKDFYVQIYKDLDGKSFGDWQAYDNLNYNADMLDEFLWYNNDNNIKYVFINFDLEIIKQEITFDDYKWRIIFDVFKDFIKQYPNNTMEIINEKSSQNYLTTFFNKFKHFGEETIDYVET